MNQALYAHKKNEKKKECIAVQLLYLIQTGSREKKVTGDHFMTYFFQLGPFFQSFYNLPKWHHQLRTTHSKQEPFIFVQ
jgi:hypothetical protein